MSCSSIGAPDLPKQSFEAETGSNYALHNVSPTIPVLHFAPKGVRAIPQLYPLIAVEIHAELRIVVVGEFKPEGLDLLPIRCEHDEMTILHVQILDQKRLIMRPAYRFPLINPHHECIGVVLAAR